MTNDEIPNDGRSPASAREIRMTNDEWRMPQWMSMQDGLSESSVSQPGSARAGAIESWVVTSPRDAEMVTRLRIPADSKTVPRMPAPWVVSSVGRFCHPWEPHPNCLVAAKSRVAAGRPGGSSFGLRH